MKISARNKLRGKVEQLNVGPINTVVKIRLTDAALITAVITNEGVKDLALTEGGDACAVIKASNVMVGICNDEKGCGCQH